MTLINPQIDGFLIGVLFGAALFLAGLADPDKIIGTLRLKDLHAFRVIFVFVLVGMAGTLALEQYGMANFSIKPAVIVPILLGGALLGLGFGITGYCPGTGLACAASGRLDAVVAVVGMLLGALAYIAVHPYVVGPLEALLNYGKVTLPDITATPRWMWVAAFVAIGLLTLFLTRDRKRREPKPDKRRDSEEMLLTYGAGI